MTSQFSINRELRDSFLERLVSASEGMITLEDILNWLTTLDTDVSDLGFQCAANWLIRAYGSDECTANNRVTRSFFEFNESRELIEFLRSNQSTFPLQQ